MTDRVTAAVASNPDGIRAQDWIQMKAVLLTIVCSGVVSLVAYKVVDLIVGLRVTEEEEREGLDISAHGETAYHNCSRQPSSTAIHRRGSRGSPFFMAAAIGTASLRTEPELPGGRRRPGCLGPAGTPP